MNQPTCIRKIKISSNFFNLLFQWVLVMGAIVIIFTSCSQPEREKKCPFESLSMEEESTKKIKDGYQHNINAYFKLGLSKEIKLGNAELKLSDSTQIANYIDEVITSTMSYKQEDITQYNILIQNLCGKHQLLEEYSAEERLNKVEEIDSLFNVFIHILLNPKPIEKEEEKPTPPDTTTPVKKLKSKKNSQPTPTIKVDQSSEGDKSPNVISKRDVIINYGEWNQPKPDTTKNN